MTQDYPDTLSYTFGPVTAVDLALFAAAAGDHNPLHLDADVAHVAGFERPVVHGMLTMAYAARLFTQHFGTGAICKLNTRFIGVALLGQTILLQARLLDVVNNIAQYELSAKNNIDFHLVSGSAHICAGKQGAQQT